MSLRVNLMLPEEQVQTGKARRFALVKVGILVMAGLAGLAGFQAVIRMQSESSERKKLESRWADLQPDHERLNKIQMESNRLQLILDELTAARRVGTPWSPLLDELRDVTPESVQFTKIGINGRMYFSLDQDKARITRGRNYGLEVQGKVTGVDGSEVITEYVRRIPMGLRFSAAVEKNRVHLERLSRDTTSEEDDVRVFSVKIDLKELKQQ